MPQNNEQAQAIDPLTVGELITLAEAAEKSGFTQDYLNKILRTGGYKLKRFGAIGL